MAMHLFKRALLFFGFAGTLIAADPFLGTWRLDPARSSGQIPKDETVTIQKHGPALSVEVQVTTAGPDSRNLLIRYSAPASGGAGQVEKGPYDGVSLRRLAARSMETTYFLSGKEIRSTRGIVSGDGRTMTSTGAAMGTDEKWVMVFRKENAR
jgi:hypothetical protein